MASTKTKAMFALGALDIARQITRAWSSRQQAEQQRAGFGAGIRADAAQLARDARGWLPHEIDWQRLPPWRHEPTRMERMRTWLPVAIIVMAASALVVVAAHLVTRRESQFDADVAVRDARTLGAVRAGGEAIDAGVAKVVSAGSAAAVGTASTLAAGSSAIKTAAIDHAKTELDERVVRPAKKKAVLFGSLGILGLTIYVVLIAVGVQLVMEAVT